MFTPSKFCLCLIVLFCVTNDRCYSKIPDYVQVCKRDPNTINRCLLDSLEKLRPKLVMGIPELNVPSIDPYYINELKPFMGDSKYPFKALGKDIKITGASDFVVKNLSVDFDKLTLRLSLYFPKLHFEGKYKVDVQIILPVLGEGTLQADALKCNVNLMMKMKKVNRNGIEYLDFTDSDIDVNIEDYNIKLNGLFNGDKNLEDATNAALNQNKAELLKTAKPFAEKTISKIILDAANNITQSMSFDELFPIS